MLIKLSQGLFVREGVLRRGHRFFWFGWCFVLTVFYWFKRWFILFTSVILFLLPGINLFTQG